MSKPPGDDKTIDLDALRTLPVSAEETGGAASSAPTEKRDDGTVDLAPTPPDATIDHGLAARPAFDGTLDHQPSESPTADENYTEGPAKRTDAISSIPRIPGYEVMGVLGRGGMGVVYKARQIRLNRLVALKMVLAGGHASPEQLSRFFTEAEAVARLQHPNIVQIHEVGDLDGLPFFSLEYVSGGTLAEKIGGKPRPPRDAAYMIEVLAYAMAAAHERGIIHRDLKPANVLLDSDGLPKITDFGLAKQVESDSGQTKSGTLMGTPSYMSPEQARGETREIGPLSDLYSLGAMLYELLTGRPPFAGPTMLDTIVQVRTQEPVPPTRLQPKCPRDLETICLKCLQKEPRQRYANCSELADDLHRFSAGEPIQARPVGWIERSWRWCRRNPRVATLSACVGILALAVVAALGVVAVRASRERETVAQTRKIAGERLAEATLRVAEGNYRQAQDFLQWSDPMLGHADLTDVRTKLETLKAQVDVYAEFRGLLDSARFACRFGSRHQREEGRDYCHKLLALYDEIQDRKGRGAFGLPPLDDLQTQLFKEDVFEALLTAALVERELAASGSKAAQKQAAQTALGWLNRADQVLPGTRALYVQRAPCWNELGNTEADKADIEKAMAIAPTSAVDRFWRGYADHRRGDDAHRAKDFQAAGDFYRKEIAEYAAFLQQRPDNFWGYFNWANAHVALGNLHDAQVGYTACIRLRSDFPWPYNNRGTVHLRLGQPDQAVVDFNAALVRNQAYGEAYCNRGLAYLALDKADLALQDFTKAIEVNPDYAPAYTERAELYVKRKQDGLAVDDLTKILALTQDKQPILVKRATSLRTLNRLSEAVQDLNELLVLDPKNLPRRADRAELQVALGKYKDARADFDFILKQAPAAASIWRARAILYWQHLKDFDAALADFDQFLRLAPKNAQAHRSVGAILLGRRQYPAALEALDKAIALRPGYSDAIWARAQIYLKQGRAADALDDLDSLIAKLPDEPETLNVRADIFQALGKPSEAAADYSRMIELQPKAPDAYVCLARLLEKQGQAAKAAECFDRLVAAAPESMWAFVRRAEYRRDHRDFDAALADCDKAAKIAPASAVPALVRASVAAARGDAASAIEQAARILQTAPLDDGHVLFAAACVWSLAAGATKDTAQSKQFAERAADLLAQALEQGFHDLNYPEQNRMAGEPALAPIQHLPSVQKLLQ